MKRIILFILSITLLVPFSACGQSSDITFPFILSTANDYPLLKYSTKSCTVSTLCPDVYCEHKSSGANEDLCEFSSVLGYAFSDDRMYYIRYPIYKEDGLYAHLKYYNYVTGEICLIRESEYISDPFYDNGYLYFWEQFANTDDEIADKKMHLYRYNVKTGGITRLTDDSTCYGGERFNGMMLPRIVHADKKHFYIVSYPEYYRADHDLDKIESITPADFPKDILVELAEQQYLLNGFLYSIPDGTYTLLQKDTRTGESVTIAEAAVSFVMDENALYYQPRYEEAEAYEGWYNRSHGQIVRYDLNTGELSLILDRPEVHLSSRMQVSDGVLMVQLYGYTTDAHGEERYDVLPDALMYKDETWIIVEYQAN